MTRRTLAVAIFVASLAVPALAQTTPAPVVATYDNLADMILAVRDMEANVVRTILGGHLAAGEAAYEHGDYAGAAAQIALFANEGDNSVGGVRKRLLDGGHHYNAEGEDQGIYEPGYVLVTREAKKRALAASAALRQAATDGERQAAWDDFAAVASGVLGN